MNANASDANDALASWLRRRPTQAKTLGYLVFVAGILIGLWFARKPDTQGNNPAAVLLLTWVVSGITHFFVRTFWRASLISAIASGIGYVVLVVLIRPMGVENEMLGVGVIIAAVLGAGASLLMGAPVVVYRRVHAGAPSRHDR